MDLVPEAFQSHYRSAAARAETVLDKGGCKGLQARVAGRVLVLADQNLLARMNT